MRERSRRCSSRQAGRRQPSSKNFRTRDDEEMRPGKDPEHFDAPASNGRRAHRDAHGGLHRAEKRERRSGLEGERKARMCSSSFLFFALLRLLSTVKSLSYLSLSWTKSSSKSLCHFRFILPSPFSSNSQCPPPSRLSRAGASPAPALYRRPEAPSSRRKLRRRGAPPPPLLPLLGARRRSAPLPLPLPPAALETTESPPPSRMPRRP